MLMDPINLAKMNMAIDLVVVDTQDLFTERKFALSTLVRSLYFHTHCLFSLNSRQYRKRRIKKP